MITQVRHTGIVVHRVEDAIKFWKEVFSFEVISDQIEPEEFISKLLGKRNTKLRTVKLKAANETVIELLKFEKKRFKKKWYGNPSSIGLTHIALTVTNLDNILVELKSQGYEPLCEPLIPPNGTVRVCYISVIEKLLLELVEVIAKN